MSDQLISREALRKKLQSRYDNGEEDFDRGFNLGIAAAIELLDSAPTVETERPQADLAEKLNDRIEDRVCKYCQMNKHCELCEISRVFSIIALTDKEMKGGAECD